MNSDSTDVARALRYWDHVSEIARSALFQSEDWRALGFHKRVADYLRRAVEETQSAIDNSLQPGSPYYQRRPLIAVAKRYAELSAWRAEFPRLANSFKQVLSAHVDRLPRGRAGAPSRFNGQSKHAERRYVNRAFDLLVYRLKTAGRVDLLYRLSEPGIANQRSHGRNAIATVAKQLARRDGATLDAKRLSACIRDRAKAPTAHINTWAPFAGKLAARNPRPRRIKAVGCRNLGD